MQRTLNGSYKSTPNSQEPAVVKEKISSESALREEGIDEVFVARKLKDLVRAQGQWWNPKKGSWEKCEDYPTQLAAVREIAKIFGIYAKDSEGTDVPVIIDMSVIQKCRELASPSDGSYKSEANSRESEVVKEKITYESALREEGIDEAFVARKLKALLRAKKRQWNPKKGSWEMVDDHATQLAALREVAKIFGIYPSAEEKRDSMTPRVIDISIIPKCRERVPADEDSQQQ